MPKLPVSSKSHSAGRLLPQLQLNRPAIAVLLGGILMGMTPAPVNAWPLAWVALTPLWQIVLRAETTPRQAFRLGCLWGLPYHGLALSWITALHPLTWMGVPWLGSLAIALFAWSFITLLGVLVNGLWAWTSRFAIARWQPPGVVQIWLGVALWCALETLLSWGPLNWTSLSYTQSPHNLWILHLGQLSGPMAVTAAIVAVNGCWAQALTALRRDRAIASAPWAWSPQARAAVGVGLLLLLGLQGIGWVLYRQPRLDEASQQLRVGLIQGNVPTRIKLTPAGIRRATMNYTQGYRSLTAQGAEAVITPEGAIPEIWSRRYQAQNPLLQAVREAGRVLWLGTFRPVEVNGVRQLTQSLVTLNAEGQVVSQYDKVKLVPLGEYIPLEGLLGGLISRLSPIDSSLRPGAWDQRFETPFGPAIVGICYESAYSELFRQQAARGGEWIMTASNNDPYPPQMMAQHHAHDVMRAIEVDRWAVRVTNTGISGIVTPRGQARWLSQPQQYVTHLDTIYRRQSRPLYVRWGDWLTPGLLITSAIALIGRPRLKRSLTQRNRL